MADPTMEFDSAPALREQDNARSSDFFELDERRNEFLATLAHELRNPLAPIMNGLHLMALMNLGDEAEKVRAMMDRQVSHIVHLVDDLMDCCSNRLRQGGFGQANMHAQKNRRSGYRRINHFDS